jgi:phosphatidylinositol glycan class N
MPLLHGRPRGQPFLERLSVLLFAFGPVFIILSLSYEAIFYAVYAAALVIWMLVESALAAFEGGSVASKGDISHAHQAKNGHKMISGSELQLSHVRVSLFFLAFFNLGFFGCGNVASISSVSTVLPGRGVGPEARGLVADVCTHETVLPRARVPLDDRLCTLPDGTFHSSPPIPSCRLNFPHRLQGALLLYKLLIPFVALAAVSSVINRRLHLPPLSLFLIGSFLSEILTITVSTRIPREWHTPRACTHVALLQFFFRVTDTGSWLEIGSSITNFVICSLLGLFSSVLLAGGEYLLAHSVG